MNWNRTLTVIGGVASIAFLCVACTGPQIPAGVIRKVNLPPGKATQAQARRLLIPAAQIRDAVRAGRISARAAAPVFLTRVAGYSTAEAARALGRAPAVLRVQRSRAERALVA